MTLDDTAIRVVEVSPRDGLQNEPQLLPLSTKLQLIERLGACGLRCIEATSFVSPRRVPQLADAEALVQLLPRRTDIDHPVLVPNLQGYERARAAGANSIALFTAASETFNYRNTHTSIAESLARFAPVITRARQDKVRIRGYVSTVLGCPYEGEVPIAAVVDVASRLYRLGCDEISLGDTIGTGTAGRTRTLLQAVAGEIPLSRLAVHFHDTYGQALANVLVSLESGIRTVDAAVAGTGGCPYAQGASGNLATEDLVYLLHGLGLSTGIDLPQLAATGQWLSAQLGRSNNSRAGRALVRTAD